MDRRYNSTTWEAALFANGNRTHLAIPINPITPDNVAYFIKSKPKSWTGYHIQGDEEIPWDNRTPPYSVGDKLCIAEQWSPDHAAFYPHFPIVYKADTPIDIENGKVFSSEANQWYRFKWYSGATLSRSNIRSIFSIVDILPMRYSQIPIEQVRAERIPTEYLQAYRFGIVQHLKLTEHNWNATVTADVAAIRNALWDKKYPKHPVSCDPWVWSIVVKYVYTN